MSCRGTHTQQFTQDVLKERKAFVGERERHTDAYIRESVYLSKEMKVMSYWILTSAKQLKPKIAPLLTLRSQKNAGIRMVLKIWRSLISYLIVEMKLKTI
jgi:hypothetical protein